MRFLLRMTPLALVLPTTAWAGWPDDVDLDAMSQWDGTEVAPGTVTDAYHQLVRELAVTIANKPIAPAETTGVNGFDVSFYSTIGFIEARHGDGADPGAFERAHADGDPTGVMWVPTLSMRKGLPLSLEFGANVGYIAFSRQAVVGGYGRWGLLEGYRQYPDLTVQVGYAGYVGNEQLELGVMDASASIGYTLPFGTLVGINEATFSPYGGVGVLRISADPRMSADEQVALGVGPARASKSSEDYVEGMSPVNLHLGFRIRTGDFQVQVLGTLAPTVLPTVNMGFGYVF